MYLTTRYSGCPVTRESRSKKTLQNAVLRTGANLKKVQSSESGFFRALSQNHEGKSHNHSPAQCFGHRFFFAACMSDTVSHGSEAESTVKHCIFATEQFCEKKKNAFLKSELFSIGEMLFVWQCVSFAIQTRKSVAPLLAISRYSTLKL